MKYFRVLLFVFSLLLGACGNAGASAEPVTTLDVEMTEFMFAPATYIVPAGQEITLNLSNDGAIVHEFLVLKLGVSVKVPFDHDARAEDILFQAKLNPGNVETFTLILPEPGEYEVLCAVPGHIEAGMLGSITAK